MSDLNKKILDAMRNSKDDLAATDDDGGIFKLIALSFRGQFRYTVMFVMLLVVVFLSLAAYCAWQMLATPDVGAKVEWLAGLLVSFIIVGLLRLWYFLELNRLSIVREVKRVELQVALLAERLGAD
ncbi:MAG: hypothetical protein Q8L60_11715 [Gammaproteobacteria bacterium]|nr:hypothetical protein [Gammaproteobacteria bacterium]MDP2139265.1 hypothetical protein [Gammaproteobacteria bacterium]MDP2348966.1 hypothetical protein [Gammaproteobacteria bacterium]